MKINKFKLLLSTFLKLGVINSFTVLVYRIALRLGLFNKVLPVKVNAIDPFVRQPKILSDSCTFDQTTVVEEAHNLIYGRIPLFYWQLVTLDAPHIFTINPITKRQIDGFNLHWSQNVDKSCCNTEQDIKLVWAASRFEWALTFARAYRVTGDSLYFESLFRWVNEWIINNPVNQGPNWKCGQEASIRMLNFLLSLYLLDQHLDKDASLIAFVEEHCERISKTIRYAIAQDNNHGTSEALGLFVGGALLQRFFDPSDTKRIRKARRWQDLGRHWLENRVNKLIISDGSFSMYSTNYHRVLVDTLCLAEFWRKELSLSSFSKRFYQQAQSSVEWLYQFTDSYSGDIPNIGANDGSRFLSLTSTSYRDYRPSVQLGFVLFFNHKVYPEGLWDEAFYWLKLNTFAGSDFDTNLSRNSSIYPDAGYTILHASNGKSWGCVKFPQYSFRPSHADALHFDLWWQGVNILRDGGTFSYHSQDPWQSYFSGTASHNTVQFDGRDQMPKISRFLFGDWLKMSKVGKIELKGTEISWSGKYYDQQGAWHCRTVESNGNVWTVIDEIGGYDSQAVLRWRLMPDTWELIETTCIGNSAEIDICSNVEMLRKELVVGWESRYYFQKTELPVFEIEVGPGSAVITTRIILKV